jgi:asparagine synthase (glutamine-hydrolysing)
LESRVPFMDNDLVDFAMQCPLSLKLNNLGNVLKLDENDFGNKTSNYFQKTNDGKQILRDVMSSYIPADISNAVKRGFSAPDASWFKGESINFTRQILFNESAKIYDILDYKSVIDLIHEHLSGKQNRRLLIWSLLNFELWLEHYL